jgi:hypothetical protein
MNMQSEQINELAAALSRAQSMIDGATKDSSNPFHKSKYADLHSVISCAKEALGQNGLSVSQLMQTIDGQIHLITLVMHKSGQWIRSAMGLSFDKLDPQTIGKVITYFRRYCYAAALGITQTDDDAESAMERPKKEAKLMTKPEEKEPTIEVLLQEVTSKGIAVDKKTLLEFILSLRDKSNAKGGKVISDKDVVLSAFLPGQMERFCKTLESFLSQTDDPLTT